MPTELNKNIENLTNEIKSRKEIEIQVEKEHKRQLTDLKEKIMQSVILEPGMCENVMGKCCVKMLCESVSGGLVREVVSVVDWLERLGEWVTGWQGWVSGGQVGEVG